MRHLPYVLLLATIACAGGEKPSADTTASAPATPNVVTVIANDFAYTAPDTIPSGMTTFRLVNQGQQIHHVTIQRVGEGKTFADYSEAMKALKPGAPLPTWITEEGGPNPPAPNDTTSVTQEMQPGTYVLICFVDTPDRVPHFAKGMVRPLIVTPSSTASAPAPTEDVKVVMKEYAWEITPALTAGRHTLKVENAGAQAHEFFIVKLHEGKTPEDMGKWAATYQGPPPGTAMGGLTGMRPGGVSWVDVNLTPGNYMMICFVPDAKDGKGHMQHGMVLPFTIS
ncbi:MAG: hypothetical protein H7066_18270 [Cytophagaceae bacterium]|nr:hypothetical protein [Gemmatimonadaceae bacterium]